MAKTLNNLIRLHKWRVDERRRELGAVLGELEELEAVSQALEEEIAREQDFVRNADGLVAVSYGTYAGAVVKRREAIAGAIAGKQAEVEAAQERLRTAYRELKTYEVTQENREKREKAERDRREQITLDEMGLQQHRRKQGG